MENTIKDKPKSQDSVIDPKLLTGKWELKIKTQGSNGSQGFGGRYLTAYIHPLTKKKTYLYNMDDQPLIGFNIERLTTVFDASQEEQRRIVDWLIAHPEVMVEGVNIDSRVRKGNKTITLINLDQQSMKDIDDEEVVDMVIGRLSEENGPKAIGLKKLRWLLAYFNISYFDMRNITNPTAEKKILRKRLKTYARTIQKVGGHEERYGAYYVSEILDQIDSLETIYYIKEMIRNNILVLSNGSFKYNNVPLGTTVESVSLWFNDNGNIYQEALNKVLPIMKSQGLN